VSYALPSSNTCTYTGLATLGGQAPTPSWILRCDRTGVFSHEIGHNLLFHHASTPTSEYGDATDPMGAAANVQFNAANRVMAGWAGGSQLVDAATGGSYAIDAIENMSSANPLVLRMPKADTGDTYYVSLRQAAGNDVNLPLYANGALSVHYATGTLPAQSFRVANLAAGQTWTDSVNGVSVTHQGLTGSGATVAITRGGATCSRLAPSVSATPLSQSAAPGGMVSYAVTVSNNNSTACASSTFNLSQVVPAGFAGTLASGSVTLAPGASATVNWSVSSATTVTDATYDVTARASESSTTNASEVHASYTVLTPTAPPPPPPPPPSDTTPPSLAITNPAAGAVLSTRGGVTISATASDASGIAAVEFLVDGKLIATDTGTPYSTGWNLRKAGVGSHTITVRARDSVGNVAAQSVLVTVSK
jgi:hypothetical protein